MLASGKIVCGYRRGQAAALGPMEQAVETVRAISR